MFVGIDDDVVTLKLICLRSAGDRKKAFSDDEEWQEIDEVVPQL